MRSIRIFILIAAIPLFYSCRQSISFEEPQPPDVDDLNSFPSKLQGEFYDAANYFHLIITSHEMIRTRDLNETIPIHDLDSNLRITGDSVIDVKTHVMTGIERKGDSITLLHPCYVDTIFRISKTNILRKFRGYYFINKQNGDKDWSVKRLQLTRGQIILGSISSYDDINKLKEITQQSSDTIPFKTTKSQIKKILKEDGFSDDEIYTRVK